MTHSFWQTLATSARWWLGLPAAVTLLGLLPGEWIGQATLLLLYLCSVLYTSLRAGQSGVLLCSIVSYGAFSFFHTPPFFSFHQHIPDELFAVFVFAVFAILAGHIAFRLSQLKDAERKRDEERLRAALLASVSHDLKTPLVTMYGAATTLRDLRQDLSQQDAAELVNSIISEAQRLESYIQNLLDMTRLGHGGLPLTRDWVSVQEIYHVVEKRIARLLPGGHRLHYRESHHVPALHVHAALVEQALFNVVHNSLKASGSDSEIFIETLASDGKVVIRVCDHGPGLPQSEWERVFDQFYTFSLGDRYEKGTGLGLSICRSILRVHMGDARIVPAPPGYNHCVELSLPAGPVTKDDAGREESSGDHDQDSGN